MMPPKEGVRFSWGPQDPFAWQKMGARKPLQPCRTLILLPRHVQLPLPTGVPLWCSLVGRGLPTLSSRNPLNDEGVLHRLLFPPCTSNLRHFPSDNHLWLSPNHAPHTHGVHVPKGTTKVLASARALVSTPPTERAQRGLPPRPAAPKKLSILQGSPLPSRTDAPGDG